MSLTLKYITKPQLDKLFRGQVPFIVLYTRERCPDCSFSLDNFLLSYAASFDETKTLYVFDLEPYGYFDDETHTYSKAYYRFMDKFGLSAEANPRLGYGTGHVPCYHYVVANGKLPNEDISVIADACVTYNDRHIVATTGRIVIETSFFDGTRPLKYTGINLKGRTLPAWRRIELAVYHDELARAFLSHYLKKVG